jgi:hypothetical protein
MLNALDIKSYNQTSAGQENSQSHLVIFVCPRLPAGVFNLGGVKCRVLYVEVK